LCAQAAAELAQGSFTTQFAYNGDGVRTSKTASGDTTEYVLDLAAALPVVISDTEAVYLYGLDIIAQQQSERLYYLHDGLGSVRQLVDTTGQIETNYAYDPFGVPLVGGDVYNPYQFTGEAWDAEVELLYLRARYYQPEVGRFITKDPWAGDVWRPSTLDPYPYVTNDPINLVDPRGLQDEGESWWRNTFLDPGYWRSQRHLQPQALASLASSPWRILPGEYCLPGDLGCWGGEHYGGSLESLHLYQWGYLYGPQSPWLPAGRVGGLSEGQYDLTAWLVEQLNTNTKSAIGCTIREYHPWPGAWIGWMQMVRGGGVWDYKPDLASRKLLSIIICGRWCAFDVPANINFGYVGRSVGFTSRQLIMGAGVAQILDNVIKPILRGDKPQWEIVGPRQLYFDERGDATAIMIGMELYDTHGDHITEEELCGLFEKYAHPAPPLEPLHPGQPQY
jgi:RHS repeat-associated protein